MDFIKFLNSKNHLVNIVHDLCKLDKVDFLKSVINLILEIYRMIRLPD